MVGGDAAVLRLLGIHRGGGRLPGSAHIIAPPPCAGRRRHCQPACRGLERVVVSGRAREGPVARGSVLCHRHGILYGVGALPSVPAPVAGVSGAVSPGTVTSKPLIGAVAGSAARLRTIPPAARTSRSGLELGLRRPECARHPGGVDRLLALRATTPVVDTLAAILDPINGTVRGLARFRTGAKVKEFAEAPWGDAVADTGLVVRYHFAGREYDSESGLYYMRARYYDPALGRWISEDPIGIAGGLNVYAYAGNDPVNLTDPSGLDPDCKPIDVPPRGRSRGLASSASGHEPHSGRWAVGVAGSQQRLRDGRLPRPGMQRLPRSGCAGLLQWIGRGRKQGKSLAGIRPEGQATGAKGVPDRPNSERGCHCRCGVWRWHDKWAGRKWIDRRRVRQVTYSRCLWGK
ncbi:MAG: RHS repeat-associated core domain-containing protein [Gemmatimonadetes bacterium]|nr:RHS repeat-associated core domain-containing protein [Gemmatimonadota bacterium]